MSSSLSEVVERQAINVALTIVGVAVWLGLNSYLDGSPTETDAHQAAAEVADAIANAERAQQGNEQ